MWPFWHLPKVASMSRFFILSKFPVTSVILSKRCDETQFSQSGNQAPLPPASNLYQFCFSSSPLSVGRFPVTALLSYWVSHSYNARTSPAVHRTAVNWEHLGEHWFHRILTEHRFGLSPHWTSVWSRNSNRFTSPSNWRHQISRLSVTPPGQKVTLNERYLVDIGRCKKGAQAQAKPEACEFYPGYTYGNFLFSIPAY